MIFNDDIHQYCPIMWQRLHPHLFKEAFEAKKKGVVEIKEVNGAFYWRRDIDNKELELGL